MKRLILGIGLWLAALTSAAAITVDVAAEKQEFLGFGAQIWPGQEQLEPAYAQLGIRWVRLSVPGMRECPMMQGSVDEFAAYFQPKIANDSFRSTYEMLKRNQVTLLLNAFSIPTAWQDQEKQLPNERLDLFARMWAGAVKCLVENGMPPQWLELFNEPDGTWSGRCWPDKYNKVVQKVRAEQDRLGYQDIQICGPGLAHVDLQGPDQWVEGLDKEGVDAIDAWSLHGYEWHRRESAAVLREELNNGFLASVKKQDPRGEKPLLITEYGSFCTNFHGQAYLSVRDGYSEKTTAQLPAWNVRVIENGLSFLNEGIHTLIYWQLADVNWGSDNFGIFSRPQDGSLPQMPYDSLRGFFPEVAEGFRVVETQQESGSPLYAAALKNGRRVVVCVANHSDREASTQLRLRNAEDVRLIRRHCFENGSLCTQEPSVEIGKAMELTVPGDAYVTLVFEAGRPEAQSVATVCPDRPKQKIAGFGGCAWTGDPGALALMPELGMTWVRFNMEGIRQFDQPKMNPANYVDWFRETTQWDRIKYLWAIKKRLGLTFMMTSYGAPACWENKKGELEPRHAEDVAKLWVAAVKAYAEQGFAPEYIELFNEPDGHWDVYCAPRVYNEVVKAVRRELKAEGLNNVKIVGPGLSRIDYGESDDWIDALDEEGLKAVSALSVHGYTWDAPKVHSTEYVRKATDGFFNSATAKDPKGKKLRIMTEFSTKSTNFNGRGYLDHAHRFDSSAAESHDFAMHLSADLLSHLNAGFNTVLFWQLADQWWEEASWGLAGRMADGYPRRPIFDALKMLLPEITPGFHCVETVQDGTVTVAGFVKGGRMVVALANPSDEAVVQAVQLAGAERAVLLKQKQFTASGVTVGLPRTEVRGEWIAELPARSLTVTVFDVKR